ncbi:MAG: bifunctional demethylmenaquinone methyltransferase/2-methoxy-6-polyprenyl-1,4-benzoquinol methylase UbiE [Candidatus Midichloria sp.]|nr:MAG: bifunctional demethylmenaquinone methyltransferase/2-methoxy-6-polyprenyl-1,4-benzoquinol methylase UbiE [Candidatus Midichloria sp.]
MIKETKEKEVNFGFQIVKESQKQEKVQKVFSDVAKKYDLMNDLMSFGVHRIWKEKFISEVRPGSEKILLDLAGGTGDIALKFVQGGGKRAIICDLNNEMLEHGNKKRFNKGLYNLPLETVCANAENLPFQDNTFDCCTISFGIRNFSNIPKALQEVRRVLKPGGRFLCLEFSQINNKVLRKFYEFYSFNIIPKIGKLVARSEDHYLYLSESIKLFPRAQKFAYIVEEAGFEFVTFSKLTFGIVAIHRGYKL